jgi:hypothetical protein
MDDVEMGRRRREGDRRWGGGGVKAIGDGETTALRIRSPRLGLGEAESLVVVGMDVHGARVEVEVAHGSHGQGGDLVRRLAEAESTGVMVKPRKGRRQDSCDGDGAAASTGGVFDRRGRRKRRLAAAAAEEEAASMGGEGAGWMGEKGGGRVERTA